MTRLWIRATFLGTAIVLACTAAFAGRSAYDWALVRLDYARQDRVEQLRHFTKRLHALAREAASDPTVVQFFDMNLKVSQVSDPAAVPASLRATVKELRAGFDQYYIERYFAFYDILFIDRSGRVFYSMRKESDLNRTLPAEGPLGSCILSVPSSEAFVDFHRYGPSNEPAAFFVEPLVQEGEHLGWLALQCAANKVNSLFASSKDLGTTGETFLVNEDGYMLTESYFEGASTVLVKRLDDRNIQAKFSDGKGHRTVTDYRGVSAISSFEVFPFMGTRWLVVAKMDRAEVATEHYRAHHWYYADRLLAALEATEPAALEPYTDGGDRPVLRIDMDEFLRAGPGECLETFGVATCTAVLAAFPGRCAYLAHVSPRDRIYGSGDTNLLGQLVRKMQSFEMYPCERREVVFVLVATHLDSLVRAIDRVVEEGFLLSQIGVVYNPEAESATVRYDCGGGGLAVLWRKNGKTDLTRCHGLEAAWNVGQAMDRLMELETVESHGPGAAG